MVEASDNNTEGTLTEFLLDLVPVIDLFFGFVEVVSLVVVETMVVDGVLVGIWVWIFILTIDFAFYELTRTFIFCVQI